MLEKKCLGCGIELQYEDKNKLGYVPEEKLMTENSLLCKRCFRIKNYGENIESALTRKEYEDEVTTALKKTDLVMLIIDIIDFESSINEYILDYLREYRSIIVINKIDLLPDYKHPSEISDWVKKRLLQEDIVPDDIAFVSAKNKYGVNGIIRKIKHINENGVKVSVIGVSNVGKSSIINLLLNDNKLTVSKYSGTTLKSSKNKISKTNITIIDTPGLIPEGRLSDILTPEVGLKLVPHGEISRKTFKLKKDQVFMFDILANFKILNELDDEITPIFSAFSSKDIKFHVTNEDRVEDLINSTFFTLMTSEQREDYFDKNTFKEKTYIINENEELVIPGLGWINVKRGPLEIELILPDSIKPVIRTGLINNKTRNKL